MKINRQGTTRIVFVFNQFVVKIPNILDGWELFIYGLLANMQESRFGKLAWHDLCPVLWAFPGGWFIVMPKARMLTREEYFAFDVDGFLEEGRFGPLPAEKKMNSFGHYDGRIVAVDYGS